MASAHSSTIAAIASPTGVGAISLIRVSGPRAIEIADLACGGIASATMPRVARRCKIRDAAGSVIDDGLLTVFLCPNSFTGEDTVEFAGHGGILVTRETFWPVSSNAAPSTPRRASSRSAPSSTASSISLRRRASWISFPPRPASRSAPPTPNSRAPSENGPPQPATSC